MKQVKAYDVKGTFELKPGGAHLMFVDVRKPFAEGETVPVTLRFERAGEKTVQFRVGQGAAAPAHEHKH
jgi:periplasmic copper chaperone A